MRRFSVGPGRWWRFCVVMSALLAGGCPPAGDDDDSSEPEIFDCELGTVNGEGGFELVPDGAEGAAELELNFQGFLFAGLLMRAHGDVPDTCLASMSAELIDEDPFGGKQPGITFEAPVGGGDEGLISDTILLFLTGTPSDWEDHVADVVVKLESEAGGTCTSTGRIRFVDEDRCIRTGEEEQCPDDAGEDDAGDDDAADDDTGDGDAADGDAGDDEAEGP